MPSGAQTRGPKPSINKYSNIPQKNIIAAQEYIYNNNKSKFVIVGSSLANGLDNKLLPEGCFNLSFAGQSAFDGLKIIKQSNSKPDVVFIETNSIDVPHSKSFINSLFMPVLYSLRNLMPALMEKNQPVCLINRIRLLKLNLQKIFNPKDTIDNTADKKSDTAHTQNVQNRIKIKFLEIHTKNFNHPMRKEIIEKRKIALQQYKKYFKELGTKIILFEMPMHKLLLKSKRIVSIRRLVKDVFPSDNYVFFDAPASTKYSTTDGVHLDRKSISLYTLYLSDKITASQF